MMLRRGVLPIELYRNLYGAGAGLEPGTSYAAASPSRRSELLSYLPCERAGIEPTTSSKGFLPPPAMQGNSR